MAGETKKFLNFLRYHLLILQFFGFTSIKYPIETTLKLRKLLTITTMIKHTVAQILIAITYIYRDNIFYTGYGFGNFGDMLKVTFLFIAYEVFFIESIWCGRADQLIHRAIFPSATKWNFCRFKWFLVKVYADFAAWLIVELTYIYLNFQNPKSIKIMTISLFIVISVKLRTTHFMFILKLITCNAEDLNRELTNLTEQCRNQNGGNKLNLMNKLSILRKRHLDLLEVIKILNDYHKWGLFFNHLRIIFKFIVDMYWNIFTFYAKTYPIEILPSAIYYSELVIFMEVCENMEKEFSKIGFWIHEFDLDIRDGLRLQIENFSLQVLIGSFNIRPLGCLNYNCGALKNIFSSLITQVIFFMQFMPIFLKLCLDGQCFW